MKINFDRCVINQQNKIIRKLPMILELDAIKFLNLNAIEEMQYVETITDLEGIVFYGEMVARMTIKWMDNEELTLIIPENDFNFLHEFIALSFKNMYDAEASSYMGYNNEEYEEDEGEEEGEEDYEEETEEELKQALLNAQPELPFGRVS
jgi:hypothetical protein